MIKIENEGPQLKATNYWASEHAARGLLYLSGNAGAWRLLLPDAAVSMLAEMRTGKSATIESSVQDARCWDVVFEDGTDSPYSVSIDKRQVDRSLTAGASRLLVYTEMGLLLELPLTIKV